MAISRSGHFTRKITIEAKGNSAKIEIPTTVKTGDTIHLIVDGSDIGTPLLTYYQRVVFTIK